MTLDAHTLHPQRAADPRHWHGEHNTLVWLLGLSLLGCSPKPPAEQERQAIQAPAPAPAGTSSSHAEVIGQTWDLCSWLGPMTQRPGVFGSDLGFAVPLPATLGMPERQQLLFGDTWAEATDACMYPVLTRDDLGAFIPTALPETLRTAPPSAAAALCDSLEYTLDDASDPTSWRRLRLFPDATARSEERALDTGMLRTPLTAWSDGIHTFAIFLRGEYARCQTHADCPATLLCTRDPAYTGKRLGGCQPQVALSSDASPAFCRDDADCTAPATCAELDLGACVAPVPFKVQRDGQDLSPAWNAEDPRNGLAAILHIASEFWPDRPEDFASGYRFATNKFMNVTARAVAHFDPLQPENSDYSEGYETLLIWGRPHFVGTRGFQALPFLLYQPLAGMIDDATGRIAWAPRYFAGYDAAGRPVWSQSEADAQPLYGVEENLVQQAGQWQWSWQAPEFDYVNQMSTLWVPQLGRWLMLYGGETPAQADPQSGMRPAPTNPQNLAGAIHLRSAVHPFGRASAQADPATGFSVARPVLTRSAVKHQLACDDEVTTATDCTPELGERPTSLLTALGNVVTDLNVEDYLSASAACLAGTVALDAQYSVGNDSAGRLYGAAFISSWTQDVSATAGEPAVDLYWNVSTWNPYQVLLMKTLLRASDLDLAR